jgi:hypothetical protein
VSVPARAYLSIGEVLSKLRGDFPDITISKIRFLESEGLIEPQPPHPDIANLLAQTWNAFATYFLLSEITTFLYALSRTTWMRWIAV